MNLLFIALFQAATSAEELPPPPETQAAPVEVVQPEAAPEAPPVEPNVAAQPATQRVCTVQVTTGSRVRRQRVCRDETLSRDTRDAFQNMLDSAGRSTAVDVPNGG